eukprot:gene665-1118_t
MYYQGSPEATCVRLLEEDAITNAKYIHVSASGPIKLSWSFEGSDVCGDSGCYIDLCDFLPGTYNVSGTVIFAETADASPSSSVLQGLIIVLDALPPVADRYRAGTNHLAVFITLLALADIISDILYIHSDLSEGNEEIQGCYYAAVMFLVLSTIANAAVIIHFLIHEMRNNRDMYEWVAENTSVAALIFFLAFTNVEVFTVVSCRALPFLNAKLPPQQETRVQMLGLVTNLLEDVPQAVILVFANSLTGTWSSTAMVSFVATVLAICYGIAKRMVSSILLFTIEAQAYLHTGGGGAATAGGGAATADATAPTVASSAAHAKVQMPELMKEGEQLAVNPEGRKKKSAHRNEVHFGDISSGAGVSYTEYNNPLADLDDESEIKVVEMGISGELRIDEESSVEVVLDEEMTRKRTGHDDDGLPRYNEIRDGDDAYTRQQVASAAFLEETSVMRSLSA